VMFVAPLPGMVDIPIQDTPGYHVFERLIEAVAETLQAAGLPAGDREAFTVATLIWENLHGIVSLRISRPRFPWPPLADNVKDSLTRLLPPPTPTPTPTP
jgi:hypothetical protein